MPPEDVSKWLVLGIESSCDDTAAAVVTGDGVVRSHRIASQVRGRALIMVHIRSSRDLKYYQLSILSLSLFVLR